MCMLTYFDNGVRPDLDALANGATNNRDGHGYAIVIPDSIEPRLIVRHGLDSDELICQFDDERALYPEGPALFHSRFGTSGEEGLFNCHPFNVAGDSRTVVAHNGVLPIAMQPNKNDRRCDTHLAADEIFPRRFGNLSKNKARRKLENAIGIGNKLVILTIDPAFDRWAYIANESAGYWEKGIWYSNRDYEPRKWASKSWTWPDYSYSRSAKAANGGEACYWCYGQDTVDPETAICAQCDTCVNCYGVRCICAEVEAAEYAEEMAEMEEIERSWDRIEASGYNWQNMTEAEWLQFQAFEDKLTA